ncbi:MAG: 50S ribosomal protein L4 [Anaerolineae bacterium]
MEVTVHNTSGEAVGTVELRDDVFGIEPHIPVMHQHVVRQHANARLGTHKAKGRSEVSGGGRKPWRQKGTGRARQGSIRAPQWKGGGVVHGPIPHKYTKKMNRKMRHLALRSALSVKAGDQQLVVLDALKMEAPKTAAFADMLAGLGVEGSVLVLLPEADVNVELSARNLPYVKTVRATCLSVRDLLGYDIVMMPLASVDAVHRMLGQAE